MRQRYKQAKPQHQADSVVKGAVWNPVSSTDWLAGAAGSTQNAAADQGRGTGSGVKPFSSMDQLNDAIDELFPAPGKMAISSTGSFDAKAFMGGSLDCLPPAFSSADGETGGGGGTATSDSGAAAVAPAGGSGTMGNSTDFHSSALDSLPATSAIRYPEPSITAAIF